MTATSGAGPIHDISRTALLFVDPYNDFLAPKGKLWPMVAEVATTVGTLDNLRKATAAARQVGMQIVIVPHHRWSPGELEGWDHPGPYMAGGYKQQIFAVGDWGGEWHPDFAPQSGDLIATEHWVSSGFANTNLDTLLKQKGITHTPASRPKMGCYRNLIASMRSTKLALLTRSASATKAGRWCPSATMTVGSQAAIWSGQHSSGCSPTSPPARSTSFCSTRSTG